MNVTNHRNHHHPDVNKEEFLYDSKSKADKLGRYKEYEGYQCSICSRVVKNLKKHFQNMHHDIDINCVDYEQCKLQSSSKRSLKTILQSYEKALVSRGVAKRNQVSAMVAKSYCRQISSLIQGVKDLENPNIIYGRLQDISTKEGGESTKYAYLATFTNFLQYLELEFSDIRVEKIMKHVNDFLRRQRSKKEKRSTFVKEKSRRKLQDVKFPFSAIKKYEEKTKAEIGEILSKKVGALKRPSIETLYSDTFLKVICRLGSRPGVFIGMTHRELNDAETTKKGNFSILVAKQKEKQRHGCVVVSSEEFKQILKVSKHAYAYLKKTISEQDPVFPSLAQKKNLLLANQEFNKIFGLRSSMVFAKVVTATDVRKIITRCMADQSPDIQRCVAQSEGHSIDVAEKVYNIRHPYEIVERAREAMGNIALQGMLPLHIALQST